MYPIRQARLRLGWSQTDLVQRVGVSQPFISKIGLVGGGIAFSSGVVGQGLEDVSSGVGLDPVRVAFGGGLNSAGGALGGAIAGKALQTSGYAAQGAAARGLKSIETEVAKEVFAAEVKAMGAGIGSSVATNGFIDGAVGEVGW